MIETVELTLCDFCKRLIAEDNDHNNIVTIDTDESNVWFGDVGELMPWGFEEPSTEELSDEDFNNRREGHFCNINCFIKWLHEWHRFKANGNPERAKRAREVQEAVRAKHG